MNCVIGKGQRTVAWGYHSLQDTRSARPPLQRKKRERERSKKKTQDLKKWILCRLGLVYACGFQIYYAFCGRVTSCFAVGGWTWSFRGELFLLTCAHRTKNSCIFIVWKKKVKKKKCTHTRFCACLRCTCWPCGHGKMRSVWIGTFSLIMHIKIIVWAESQN